MSKSRDTFERKIRRHGSAGFSPLQRPDGGRNSTVPTPESQGMVKPEGRAPWVSGLLLVLALFLPPAFASAQETDGWRVTRQAGPRFTTVDIFIDSGTHPLAAWQLHFSLKSGEAKIVGIEGGEHPAFRQPPYYDPKAIQRERVILAAFNAAAADKLPKGKTRVATIHLQMNGTKAPQYLVRLQTAADDDAHTIPCVVTFEPRN